AMARKLDVLPEKVRERLAMLKLESPGISDHDVKPYTSETLKWSLVVAGAASGVFTGGVGTAAMWVAIAGLAVSAGGIAVQELKVARELLGEKGAFWMGLGLQIAGAITTGGSALAPGAGKVVVAESVAAGVNGATQITTGVDRI